MNDERIKTAALARFTQYMNQHNLRKTPERYAILEKVMEMNSHFFIDNLYAALEVDGYHVCRATIYNTIELLVDAQIVRRHSFDAHSTQYEKIDNPASCHHHLVCTRCGKIKEVKDAEIDMHINSRRYGTFHPIYADLYIYGICSRCARRRKTSKKV